MSRLKLVLVGLGKMGRNHLRVILEDSRFELVAVVDPKVDPGTAGVPAGVSVLKSLRELSAPSFDCAVIAAPTELHFDLSSELLTFKKPILLEKPLASSPEQGKLLLEKIKAAGVPFAVGHLERFNPAVRKLKEVLSSQWIGKVLHFSITRVGGYPQHVQVGNNVLLDLAVHDFDVLNFLVGAMEVKSSICHSSWQPGILDTAEILASGPQGVSASLHVNWVTPTKIRTLRVTGTQGVCFVDYILQTCELMGGNLLKKSQGGDNIEFSALVEAYKQTDRVEFGVKKEEPLKVQLGEFYKLVKGEPSEVCLAQDAELAVRLAHRAVEISSPGVRT